MKARRIVFTVCLVFLTSAAIASGGVATISAMEPLDTTAVDDGTLETDSVVNESAENESVGNESVVNEPVENESAEIDAPNRSDAPGGFGSAVSSFVQSTTAETGTTIDQGMWNARVGENATGQQGIDRASALADRVATLHSQRVELADRRANGSISAMAFAAADQRLTAQLEATRSAATATRNATPADPETDRALAAVETAAQNAQGPPDAIRGGLGPSSRDGVNDSGPLGNTTDLPPAVSGPLGNVSGNVSDHPGNASDRHGPDSERGPPNGAEAASNGSGNVPNGITDGVNAPEEPRNDTPADSKNAPGPSGAGSPFDTSTDDPDTSDRTGPGNGPSDRAGTGNEQSDWAGPDSDRGQPSSSRSDSGYTGA